MNAFSLNWIKFDTNRMLRLLGEPAGTLTKGTMQGRSRCKLYPQIYRRTNWRCTLFIRSLCSWSIEIYYLFSLASLLPEKFTRLPVLVLCFFQIENLIPEPHFIFYTLLAVDGPRNKSWPFKIGQRRLKSSVPWKPLLTCCNAISYGDFRCMAKSFVSWFAGRQELTITAI